MRIASLFFTLGVIVMAGAIIYAFVFGGLFDEARVLFGYPWFHVSLIDLYIGFFLFSGWIVFREQSRLATIIWILLLLTLGNLVACLYALIAAVRAQGDWRRFWLGKQADLMEDKAVSSLH